MPMDCTFCCLVPLPHHTPWTLPYHPTYTFPSSPYLPTTHGLFRITVTHIYTLVCIPPVPTFCYVYSRITHCWRVLLYCIYYSCPHILHTHPLVPGLPRIVDSSHIQLFLYITAFVIHYYPWHPHYTFLVYLPPLLLGYYTFHLHTLLLRHTHTCYSFVAPFGFSSPIPCLYIIHIYTTYITCPWVLLPWVPYSHSLLPGFCLWITATVTLPHTFIYLHTFTFGHLVLPRLCLPGLHTYTLPYPTPFTTPRLYLYLLYLDIPIYIYLVHLFLPHFILPAVVDSTVPVVTYVILHTLRCYLPRPYHIIPHTTLLPHTHGCTFVRLTLPLRLHTCPPPHPTYALPIPQPHIYYITVLRAPLLTVGSLPYRLVGYLYPYLLGFFPTVPLPVPTYTCILRYLSYPYTVYFDGTTHWLTLPHTLHFPLFCWPFPIMHCHCPFIP